MLLLSRRVEESILVGDDVEIKILAVERGRVTLGIQAPARVAVHRREVYDAIRTHNLASAGTSRNDLNDALLLRQKTVGAPAKIKQL